MAKDKGNQPDEDKSEEEKIGFHKGALSTLSKERQELSKMLQVVEQLMQMHVSSLKELGVDLEEEADQVEQGKQKKSQKEMKEDRPPIEDLLQDGV